MTEPYKPERQPFFAFRRNQLHLSIGRGGHFFYLGEVTVYPAKTASGYTPPTRTEFVVGWGGRWRFRIVPEVR